MSRSRLSAPPSHPAARLRLAAGILNAGGVVAHPTEGVYGLACRPDRTAAILRLLELKQRPAEKGLILIASDWRRLSPWVAPPTHDQLESMLATWPGAVTWLVAAANHTPLLLRGAHPTVAIRVTAHPLTRALCEAAGGVLVSTSANRSGQRPALTPLRVKGYFADQLDLILAGPLGGHCGPSTIRDLASGRVIRGTHGSCPIGRSEQPDH